MRSNDGEVEPSSGSRSGFPSYNLSVCFADSSPSRGASGETVHFAGTAKASPFGSNGDDRRQWRKQGGAVGAAASRMRAAAKQTLGAATRAVALRSNDGEVELLSQRGSLCLRALREFVENARLKRKEFVNVIKMRRRY